MSSYRKDSQANHRTMKKNAKGSKKNGYVPLDEKALMEQLKKERLAKKN